MSHRARIDGGFLISFTCFYLFEGLESFELTHILQITCTRRINTSDVPMEATRLWQNVHLLLFSFLFFFDLHTVESEQQIIKVKKNSFKKSHFYQYCLFFVFFLEHNSRAGGDAPPCPPPPKCIAKKVVHFVLSPCWHAMMSMNFTLKLFFSVQGW